jgi:hypothetical protein
MRFLQLHNPLRSSKMEETSLLAQQLRQLKNQSESRLPDLPERQLLPQNRSALVLLSLKLAW